MTLVLYGDDEFEILPYEVDAFFPTNGGAEIWTQEVFVLVGVIGNVDTIVGDLCLYKKRRREYGWLESALNGARSAPK